MNKLNVLVGIPCLVSLALACSDTLQPTPIAVPSTSSDTPTQTHSTMGDLPAPLLSEDAAISILRNFLIDCIASWDKVHEPLFSWDREFKRGGSVPTGQERDLWNRFTTQASSARYVGLTTIPGAHRGLEQPTETWVIVGPGLERTGGGSEQVLGTWEVHAGHRIAWPLDGPARIALEEFKRPLDLYYDPDCTGYRNR